MKSIIPTFDNAIARPMYLQLYDYLREAVLSGQMAKDEKLPSIRNLAKDLSVSVTTVDLAYGQLLVEGYIYSKPRSGYYISEIIPSFPASLPGQRPEEDKKPEEGFAETSSLFHISLDNVLDSEKPEMKYDLSCFDFNKWKKCMSRILTEHSSLLMFESEPQGEKALRYEICKYLYSARGVTCSPEQIVIGAGTQQITGHLSLLLKKSGIASVVLETPGYMPVRNIFRDQGFSIISVPVDADGIIADSLPSGMRTAAYINPGNQFPTGAVIPIGNRYRLIDWAFKNHSFIIEDDYDSELRYTGKPIPAMQGLDSHQRVVYLGSFSSTLFSSMKISYMVLPTSLLGVFNEVKGDYTQTCSKIEQLTLAAFMEQGLYQKNIKKLRNLYSQKLQAAMSALTKEGKNFITTLNTSSGINIIILVKSKKNAETLKTEAASLGITALPVALNFPQNDQAFTPMVLYYNQIPFEEIKESMEALVKKWKTL